MLAGPDWEIVRITNYGGSTSETVIAYALGERRANVLLGAITATEASIPLTKGDIAVLASGMSEADLEEIRDAFSRPRLTR